MQYCGLRAEIGAKDGQFPLYSFAFFIDTNSGMPLSAECYVRNRIYRNLKNAVLKADTNFNLSCFFEIA